MSQFGMQMPGGRQRHGASPDVFTALLFFSVVALGVACYMMWQAASAVGPDGDPFRAQTEGQVRLVQSP